jgi:hypothetical protein
MTAKKMSAPFWYIVSRDVRSSGMVVLGVAQYEHYAFAMSAWLQQLLQKSFERQCIEVSAHRANELSAAQIDHTETDG